MSKVEEFINPKELIQVSLFILTLLLVIIIILLMVKSEYLYGSVVLVVALIGLVPGYMGYKKIAV